jgi:DNA-binding NtrC family response regulator
MAKILIIDDDGMVRDALTVFLTRAGHEVTSVVDGADGLLVFKNNHPDLVVLDRELPSLSGSEVLAGIMGTAPETRVIILTGYDSPEDADKYIKSGATSFLSKADGLSNVLTEIERILGEFPKTADVPEDKSSSGVNPPLSRAGGGRILIVDDDDSIREVLSRFLVSEGYVAFSVADGKAALAFVERDEPDIVLLDIYMPEMNGTEVLKELREKRPGVDVLMITGNADEEVARDCLKGGAFDYISKPVNLSALQTLIRARLLVRRKTR